MGTTHFIIYYTLKNQGALFFIAQLWAKLLVQYWKSGCLCFKQDLRRMKQFPGESDHGTDKKNAFFGGDSTPKKSSENMYRGLWWNWSRFIPFPYVFLETYPCRLPFLTSQPKTCPQKWWFIVAHRINGTRIFTYMNGWFFAEPGMNFEAYTPEV